MDANVEQLQELVTHQKPEKADAIVWLQGDRFDRAEKVLKLHQKGFAPRIVLTGNNVLIGQGPRPGENNISLDEMHAWLLEQGLSDSSMIVDDTAMNSRDQATNVLSIAQKDGWKTLLLVGSAHHQLRPFLTFLKRANEIGWKGTLINQLALVPAWDEIPSGRDKTAREIFADEVMKLQTYHEHVATVEEGLAHIQHSV